MITQEETAQSAVQHLVERALFYLRGIQLTEPQIRAWLADEKRCRVYVVRDGRSGNHVHFRLSCFDREINRQLHTVYGIGCRWPYGETMWTKNVAQVIGATDDPIRPQYIGV